MGFGNAGFAIISESVEGSFASIGAESSENAGPNTDILIFNMSASTKVGVNVDDSGHEVSTSVQVDTV